MRPSLAFALLATAAISVSGVQLIERAGLAGAECTTDDQCSSLCNLDTNTCALSGLGDACSADSDCSTSSCDLVESVCVDDPDTITVTAAGAPVGLPVPGAPLGTAVPAIAFSVLQLPTPVVVQGAATGKGMSTRKHRSTTTSAKHAESTPKACSTRADCADGHTCFHSHCKAKGVEGAECYKPDNCLSHSCTKNGKCTKSPAKNLAIGDLCRLDQSCASGYCDNGVCATPGGKGADCSKGAACLAGICPKANHFRRGHSLLTLRGAPNFPALKCPAAPYSVGLGHWCLKSSHCAAAGGYCLDKTCTALVRPGGECTKPQACIQGSSCAAPPSGGAKTCSLRANGQSCAAPAECSSGVCSAGICHSSTR